MTIALLSCLLSLGSAHADTTVTFNVTAPPAPFLKGAQIYVTLFDAEQLKRIKNNERCVMMWDGQVETVQCLEGTTHQPVEAETFTFSQAELAAPLRIASTTVSPGEEYKLQISGTSADACNSSSATHRGVARGASVVVAIEDVFTTAMACDIEE